MTDNLTEQEQKLAVAICRWLASEMSSRLSDNGSADDETYWDMAAGMFTDTLRTLENIGILQTDKPFKSRQIVPIAEMDEFLRDELDRFDLADLLKGVVHHSACFGPALEKPISKCSLEKHPPVLEVCSNLIACDYMQVSRDHYGWNRIAETLLEVGRDA